jgi:hypothetical protein
LWMSARADAHAPIKRALAISKNCLREIDRPFWTDSRIAEMTAGQSQIKNSGFD